MSSPKWKVEKVAGYWRVMLDGAIFATFNFRHDARAAMKAEKRAMAAMQVKQTAADGDWGCHEGGI